MVCVGVEDVEAFLHRDALISVGGILVAIDHAEDGVHGRAGGYLQ